jgi:hypothetical protein
VSSLHAVTQQIMYKYRNKFPNNNKSENMQTTKKRVWALTHGAAGPRIDLEMFKGYLKGIYKLDECHSTHDQCMHYTILRFRDAIRETTLVKFMEYAKEKYDITRSEVFGYEDIKGNELSQSISDHVVLIQVMKHKREDNPAFRSLIETPGRRGGNILEVYLKKQKSTAAGGTQARGGQRTVQDNTGKFIWIEVLATIGAEIFFFARCIWGVDG